MREVLEYVKMEFRTEPAHIELIDDESFVDFMIGLGKKMVKCMLHIIYYIIDNG